MSTQERAGAVPGYGTAQVAMAAAITAMAAWVLSFAYSAAGHYSPLVYLNAVLAFGFGWLVGRVGKAMLRRFCIDGRGAAIAVGAIGGLAGLYLAWPAYLWVITDYNTQAYLDTLTSPGLIWSVMLQLAENPVWTVGKSGSDPALMYYIAWLLEAALIVFVSVRECVAFVNDNQLCQHCRTWVAATGDEAAFALPDDNTQEVLAALSQNDIAALPTLRRLSAAEPADAGQWLEAKGYACPQCRDVNGYVTVCLVVLQENKKGEVERSASVLAHMVEIDVEMERRIFEPQPAAAVQTEQEDGEEARG